MHLSVINPFGRYRVGDHISDEGAIAEILGGAYEHHVVKHAGASPHAEPEEVKVETAGPDAKKTRKPTEA